MCVKGYGALIALTTDSISTLTEELDHESRAGGVIGKTKCDPADPFGSVYVYTVGKRKRQLARSASARGKGIGMDLFAAKPGLTQVWGRGS